MSSPASSWIFEVRQRLAASPPRPAATAQPELVVLVALYVEAGALRTVLTIHTGADGRLRLGFPGAPLASRDTPWAAVARLAAEWMVDPARVLQLGELEPVRGLEGSLILPCVAAIPGPEGDGGRPTLPAGVVGLPLLALVASEERGMEADGEERWFPLFRVAAGVGGDAGRLAAAELWGPPAMILADLRRRLGMQ